MKKIVTAVFSTILLTGSTSCSDSASGPSIEDVAPPSGIAVSNPVLASGVRTSAVPYAAAAEAVAYISAAPGTFPDASAGTLSNETRNGSSVSVTIVEGGFDPVAIIAKAGDDLRLTLTNLSGVALSPVAIKVPPRRPPKVVRTNPSRGRTDVALNVQVEVIFSEPVNRSTITSSNLSLRHGAAGVAATLELSPDGLSVKVMPDSPLEPGEDYFLVSNGIQDLDGDVLAETALTTFATVAASPVGGTSAPIASMVLLPLSPAAINDDGVVVGGTGNGETLLWRASIIAHIPNGSTFYGAIALNNNMVIAGIGPVKENFNGKEFTSTHAIQWKEGSFTDLGVLPGHNYSEVRDINAAGDIVGFSGIWDGDPEGCCSDMRAVMWHNGQISELPFLWPFSISSAGEILAGHVVNGDWKLAIWRDGISTDLTGGCFDLLVGLFSAAMNNRGQIAATCMNKPFLWQNGEVTMLPFPSGCSEGLSRDIDDLGRVVGYVLCKQSPGQRAVIWMNGSVFELPSGGEASDARTLNSRGEIVGYVNNTAVMWVLAPTQ